MEVNSRVHRRFRVTVSWLSVLLFFKAGQLDSEVTMCFCTKIWQTKGRYGTFIDSE